MSIIDSNSLDSLCPLKDFTIKNHFQKIKNDISSYSKYISSHISQKFANIITPHSQTVTSFFYRLDKTKHMIE